MVELIAATVGGCVAIAGQGILGKLSRSSDARDAVIRLTTAVEHIATQLEQMHADMKEDRKETYGRLSTVEQRLSKLEAQRYS